VLQTYEQRAMFFHEKYQSILQRGTMMEQQFVIYLSGRVLDGFEPSTAYQSFAKIYGVELKKVEKIFIGKPIRSKQKFDRHGIKQVHKKLTSIGVECRIEIVKVPATKSIKSNNPVESNTESEKHNCCEQCHHILDLDGTCSHCSAPQEKNLLRKEASRLSSYLGDTPIPILIVIASLAELAIHILIIHLMFYMQHGFDGDMIMSLLAALFIKLLIIWALLKVFRIGWIAAMITLGSSIHESLGYVLAAYNSDITLIFSLVVMIVGFTALLTPLMLRKLDEAAIAEKT